MKKNLITFFSIIMVAFCSAQPVLTDSSSNPIIGDQFVYNYTNYLSPGLSGANQTWDLSLLSVTGSVTLNAVPPTNSQFYTGFQDATVALTDVTSYNFYHCDSARLTYSGKGTQLSYQYVSHRYEKLLKYPMTYLDSFISNFNYQGYSGGIPVINTYGGGTDSVLADGYGTLILPNATYTNTLRLQYTTYENTSNSIGGSDSLVVVEYRWYARNIHMPLAILTAYTDNGSTSYSGQYLYSSVNSMQPYTEKYFEVYPNPSDKEIRIHGADLERISIRNALGELVYESLVKRQKEDLSLDIGCLDNGLYFIFAMFDKGTMAHKLLVQH